MNKQTNYTAQNVTIVLEAVFASIHMDKPSNFDDILAYILDDLQSTADAVLWNDSDVVIGFRRWIETQKL